MCKENAEDSDSSNYANIIKEESSNVDSTYFDDIFKNINTESQNFQQVAKFYFKISCEIGD